MLHLLDGEMEGQRSKLTCLVWYIRLYNRLRLKLDYAVDQVAKPEPDQFEHLK